MNANWDTIFVSPKFRLYQVLLFIERATSDQAKVSSRGPTKVNSNRNIFQLLFFLPLIDLFPCAGGIEPLQNFWGKSLGVINVNCETDNMHKWSKVACSQFWISLISKSPRVTNANCEIDNLQNWITDSLWREEAVELGHTNIHLSRRGSSWASIWRTDRQSSPSKLSWPVSIHTDSHYRCKRTYSLRINLDPIWTDTNSDTTICHI